MRIDNVHIHGINESIVASGYPMRNDLPDVLPSKPTSHRLEVATNLGSTPIGSAHDNYLNGIIIQFDLTCTIKMWQQLQRYHFIDFVSSASTIHRLIKMDLNKAYNEYIDEYILERVKLLQKKYKESGNEDDFLRLIYNNPVGMNLTARLTTNARQLKTIYHQRKNHRLKEWRDFCGWILSLPDEIHPWSKSLNKEDNQ